MDDEIKILLRKYIKDGLKLAVASNPAVKAEDVATKLKVRPVVIKGKIVFQAAKTVGTQEFHENTDDEGLVRLIGEMIDNGPQFKQLELTGMSESATVLISRKGRVTVKERRAAVSTDGNTTKETRAHKVKTGTPDAGRTEGTIPGNGKTGDHCSSMAGISLPAEILGGPDRKKNYILQEGTPVPFLVELGVMNKDGYVVKARYDKFRQINRYLEFVDDILPDLMKRKRVEIIDFGCGKSYLTFALYHFLHELKGLNVHITGLDLKKNVIADCGRLAEKLGYSDLEFKHGDIADYETTGGVDMVVTLHACDTATDYALYNAVRWNAKVIFCVPCCQHELNKQIKNKELEPVLKYGIIRERMSALITDAMRAQILEEQGYKTQILEFIDMEHTPKNLLIRAVKLESSSVSDGASTEKPYETLLGSLGSELTLHRLLKAH